MATPFVTVQQLRDFLDDQDLDEARTQLVLEVISEEIRGAVGWSVTEELDVVAARDGRGDHELLLPTLRLRSVSSVVEDGTELGAGDYLVYADGRLARMVGDSPARWTRRRQGVVVTYTHGYPADAVPGAIRMVVVEAAARIADNPGGLLKSRTVNKVAVTYADMAKAVGPVDDARLDPYRLADGGFA